MQELWNKYKGITLWILVLLLFIIIVYFLTVNDSKEQIKRVDDSFLKDYKINEVIKIYVTDEELAKKYLSEYVNLLIYHREEAYKLVDTDTLVEKFNDYSSFENYVNTLITDNFVRATVKSYSYGITDGVKAMNVIDADGNVFIFKEESLMNYTVEL